MVHSSGNTTLDAAIDFTAGCTGGTASVLVGQPLDTIKVKMQMFPHLYNNAIKCGIETFRKDGLSRGLYAGTVPALTANVAENAVLFMCYGLCQKSIAMVSGKKDIKDLNAFENASAGGAAAFFASMVLCPTELVKCRLQSVREVTGHANLGPWKMCRQIYAESGVRGFFSGLVSTFAREMPGYFVFFGAYEFSRSCFAQYYNTSKEGIGHLTTGFCGGLGGASLWISVFPADVVKSRVQINPNSDLARKSFFGALFHILKTEGIGKLYSGLGPTVIRSFFATGSLFITLENTKKLLHYLIG